MDEITGGGLHEGDMLLLCCSPVESLIDIALISAEHVGVAGGKKVIIRSPYAGDTHERMLMLAAGLTPSGNSLNLMDPADREHLYESAKRLADANITVEELGVEYTDDGTTPTRCDADLAVIIGDTEDSIKEEMVGLQSNREIDPGGRSTQV